MRCRMPVWLLLLAAVAVLASGCGGSGVPADGDASGCGADSDCRGGERCVDRQCRQICESAVERCPDGFVCTGGICLPQTASDGDRPADGDAPPADGDLPDDGDQPAPDCLDSSDCDLGHLCMDGRCVAGCRSGRDCPSGQLCDPVAPPQGVCGECLTAEQCEAHQRCVERVCRTACTNDDDCRLQPATPHCDRATGSCAACLSDDQCQTGLICLDLACVSGCRGDRDCPSGLHCDPGGGEHGSCLVCALDGHCQPPERCRQGRCVPDCSGVACPADRPYCLPETAACVACTAREHCRAGEVCVDFVCLTGCADDGDCPAGRHCRTGGAGVCVDCTADNHCPGGRCFEGSCVSGGCIADAECGNGYCHPVLHECRSLPASPCATDDQCCLMPGYCLEACDPLTRQCIPACLTELPFCLNFLDPESTRLWCRDGGCYECLDDSYCPGTPCAPFDSMCVMCGSDRDCRTAGWHCQVSSGACYECLETAHCAPRKCRADDHRCVDCLSAADCRDPARPVCGKDGACIPRCSDECAEDRIICDPADTEPPIRYLACGDHDNDPCLEFGGAGTGCPANQTCANNACICENPCRSGETKCDDDYPQYFYSCKQDTNGCWYWSGFYCTTGNTCRSGRC